MKEKKIRIEYIIMGLGKYEKTELSGLKIGSQFKLGNSSSDVVKIEEINDEFCTLIFDFSFLRVIPNKGEYVEIIEKEPNGIINIPKRVYKITVNLNEEIKLESRSHPSSQRNLKITAIYEEAINFYK